jgi:hypothetical protein
MLTNTKKVSLTKNIRQQKPFSLKNDTARLMTIAIVRESD